ncbi:probable serine/threonine-protein kinase MARK-A, partial [Panonychus citri]|uniref:probable serine/threonine-protein kinase MARK-A n=1 Tax=Panonychus citri TaxID=50023 RepID=UPI002307D4EE
THLHPHHNYYSSSGSNSDIRRDSPYTYNRGGASESYKSNSASSSRYNGNHDHMSAIDTAQVLRQQQLHQQQLQEQYLKSKQEEEKIPEWKRKEDFFAALGLVTKQTLKEIQNKKCERKRRTTANPQFSNAAIEAKRINAMEVAAKRAKRREMAASERNASAPLTRIARRNSQVPIVPIQQSSIRSSLRPSTASSSQPAGSPSSSSTTPFHQKAVFRQFPNSPSTNMTVAPDKSRNLVERLKSRYQLHTSPYQINRLPNSSSSSHNNINNNTSNNNNLRSVNLTVAKPLLVKTVHNCYACYESCDPDLDAIMACVDCRCYFHATCVASVDEINKTNSVPCPSCDKETSTTFDGFNSLPVSDDLDSNSGKNISKPEREKPILEEEEEDVEDLEEEEERMEVEENLTIKNNPPRPKVLTLEEIQRKIGQGKNPIIVMTKAEFLKNQARNQPQITIKTRENLLTRQNEIAKLINEGKKRYNELAVTLNDLKEDKIKLIQERSKIQDCLKKVTNVIKLVNESDVQIDQAKVKDQNKAPEESSVEVNDKPNETNGSAITSSGEQKTVESESSSSDDDSSDSEESDDEDQSNVTKKSDEDPEKSPIPIDQMKDEAVNDINIKDLEEVMEQVIQEHESTISVIEEEVEESPEEDKPIVTQVLEEEAVIIDSEMKDVENSLTVDETIKVEEGPSEVAQDVAEFAVGEDAIVLEEIDDIGGNEVLITTTVEEESNMVILGSESVALEKCNQFDDETSAAVASIQDFEVDSL